MQHAGRTGEQLAHKFQFVKISILSDERAGNFSQMGERKREPTMKKLILSFVIILVVVALALCTATYVLAGGAASGRFIRSNSAGGVSGGSARGFVGPESNGGHVRAFASDGQGNVAGGSVRGYKGPNGQTAVRGGEFTRSSDGSIQHKSGVTVSGEAGTVSSAGSYSRDASGNGSGQRSTTATSSTGAQYQGSTTYSSGTLTHTGTCYDASGNPVSCPGK